MDKALSLRIIVRDLARAKSELEGLKSALRQARDQSRSGAQGTLDQVRAVKQHEQAVLRVQAAQGKHREMIARQAQAASKLRDEFRGVRTAIFGVVAAAGALAATFAGVVAVVQRFEQRQNFLRALRFNVGDSAGEVDKQLRREADRIGFRQADAQQGVLKLAASGQVEIKDLIPTITAFTALAKSSGADAVQMARAFEQFTQIASQGQLQGDELRAIQENGVQLRKLLQDAGFVTNDRSNPITFGQIQEVLLQFGASAKAQRFLAEAAEQSGSAFSRLWNVIDLDLVPVIGKTLQPALLDAAREALEFVRSIDPEAVRRFTQKLVDSARGFARWVKENWEAIKIAAAATFAIGGLIKAFGAVQGIANLLATRQLVALSGAALTAAWNLEKLAAAALVAPGAGAAAAATGSGVGTGIAQGAAGGAATKQGLWARIVAWFKNIPKMPFVAGVLTAARAAWAAIAGPATIIAAALATLFVAVIKLVEVLSGIDSTDENSAFNGDKWYQFMHPEARKAIEDAARPAPLPRRREVGGADVNRMTNRINYESAR